MPTIIGKNIIKFKCNEIHSHNPADRIRTTEIGGLFSNFKKGGEIKTNTLYTHSNIKNVKGKRKVLVYSNNDISKSIKAMFEIDDNKSAITPPYSMIFDIQFFMLKEEKEYTVALYNKENNIFFCHPSVVERFGTTYYDHFAKYLKYYKVTGDLKEEIKIVISKNITVGIDGELEPVDKVSLWPFSLKELQEEDLGCVKGINDMEAPIGIDNGYWQMELRPGFGQPTDVIDSVVGLMKNLKKDKYHISTKGDKFPLGCHVHFGFGFPVKPPADLLFLLDYFIGNKMMELSGKRRGHFNERSAYRTKAHGFEYRSMPSAIMEEPEFLRVVLNICLEIVRKYSDKHKFVLEKSEETSQATLKDFESSDISIDLYNSLNKFYKDYKGVTYAKNTVAAWTAEERK